MSGFRADWLALREPADARSRAEEVLAPLAAWAAGRRSSLGVLDAGSGSGANFRWLAPRLAVDQCWRCIDNDPALLAALPAVTGEWAAARNWQCRRAGAGLEFDAGDGVRRSLQTRTLDLAATSPDSLLHDCALFTASALLDLVSATWLDPLLQHCAERRSALLLALSYDGRLRFTPQDPFDREVRALVNRHQRGDKGFGPALGPAAGAHAAARLRAHGYAVRVHRTDWRLDATARELQIALLCGWVAVAAELAADSDRLHAWHQRRLALVHAGESFMGVGHQDLLALPA